MDTQVQQYVLTVGDHLTGEAEAVPALLHHGRLLHLLHAHHRLPPQDRRPISGKETMEYSVSILWIPTRSGPKCTCGGPFGGEGISWLGPIL